MTTPIDAPMYELLAACEQLAEGYARTLEAIQDITKTYLEGSSLSDDTLLDYDEDAERAFADLERFRATVAQFKKMFSVN